MNESVALRETIFDGSNRDRLSIAAWRVMFAELWEFRELICRLAARNITGQFRQSFLGYLWIVAPPLATTVIFSLLRSAQIVQVPMPDGAMPYPLFALVGATVWGLFTQLSTVATGSLASAGTLVSKIYFPREVLVFSGLGTVLVSLVVRLLVVALSFVLFGYRPSIAVVWAPLLLIPVLVLALGIGLLLAPINTMMNDIGRLLEFAFQFGIFLAPILYPTPNPDSLQSRWEFGLYWLHTLNPISHCLYALQRLIEQGVFYWTPGLIFSIGFTLLLFFAAWRFFHVCEPLLAERL